MLQLLSFVHTKGNVWEKTPRPFAPSILKEWDQRDGREQKVTLPAETVCNSGPCSSLLVFYRCPHHHLSASLGSVFISPQNETETPHPAIQSCQELEPSASLLPFTRIEYGQLLLLTHPPCLQCPQPSLSLKPEILFVLQNLAKGLKLLRLF